MVGARVCRSTSTCADYGACASSIGRLQELGRLTSLANERFAHYLDVLGGGVHEHRVEFSRRITTCWALIYYRRHIVRLSPYVFLLSVDELKHGSHWAELDATLRHEAAHAAAFARDGDTGHSETFHAMLAKLGVDANGLTDLGPENVAFRYVYECPSCAGVWRRRVPLRGNWSCGGCGPGRYVPAHRMVLTEELGAPWARVVEQQERVAAAIVEAEAEGKRILVRVRVR